MFSIVIPLYNKSDTIERAINSVLAQEYQEFEIIVVNDGSIDGGEKFVEAILNDKIKLINQENGGVSKARNTGIEKAKYDYITFLDADDEYKPEFLDTFAKLIKDYPDAGIYGCNYEFLSPSGERKLPIINGLAKDFEGIVDNYFEIVSKSAPLLWTGAVCVKREAMLAVGGFPIGVASGEDLLTWARLCAKYPLAYSSNIGSVYYLGGIAGYLPTRVPQEDNYVGRELINILKQQKHVGLKQYIATWQKNRMSCFIRLNMRAKCLKESFIALRFAPFVLKIYAYIVMSFLPKFIIIKIFTRYGK